MAWKQVITLNNINDIGTWEFIKKTKQMCDNLFEKSSNLMQ